MALLFAFWGYLSGSVLYARVFMRLFGREAELSQSKDGNPGTANAFQYGGFWCGLLTLIGDLMKGAVPVHFFMRWLAETALPWIWAAVILAAPVIGHAFPVFYQFKGGKAIAVTFGCLLGLLPLWQPFMILAVFFIVFSVAVRVTPHFYRTIAAYLCACIYLLFYCPQPAVVMGFLIMACVVCLRLYMSQEEKERMRIQLWMH